jgi:hypothetical protein
MNAGIVPNPGSKRKKNAEINPAVFLAAIPAQAREWR